MGKTLLSLLTKKEYFKPERMRIWFCLNPQQLRERQYAHFQRSDSDESTEGSSADQLEEQELLPEGELGGIKDDESISTCN